MKQLIKNRWKPFSLAALMAVGLFGLSNKADAAKVMCLKTNTGQYIEVVRVSMMVVADGASTFEIVVKDGLGATNVESISPEQVSGWKFWRQSDHRHFKTSIPSHQHG